MRQYLLCLAPDQKPADPAAAVRSHEDQVAGSPFGSFDDALVRFFALQHQLAARNARFQSS